MGRSMVTIQFDADSHDDAVGRVHGWTLHEGCEVSVTYHEQTAPLVVDEAGALQEREEALPPTAE